MNWLRLRFLNTGHDVSQRLSWWYRINESTLPYFCNILYLLSLAFSILLNLLVTAASKTNYTIKRRWRFSGTPDQVGLLYMKCTQTTEAWVGGGNADPIETGCKSRLSLSSAENGIDLALLVLASLRWRFGGRVLPNMAKIVLMPGCWCSGGPDITPVCGSAAFIHWSPIGCDQWINAADWG